jgi:RNA polymerase sigma factor (sigma-70 family)
MWRFIKSSKNINSEEDAVILAAYKSKGDLKYIAVLYSRYAQLTFAVCMKYLKDEEASKDAVSMIFEKLVVDLKRFEVKHFNAWLHRIAHNYCLTYLEKKGKYIQVEPDLNRKEDDDQPEPDYATITDMQLKLAINKLDLNQQQCIQLFYFDNKSYQEVAAETGFSLLQVKSYLQNGKRNLKTLLKSNES